MPVVGEKGKSQRFCREALDHQGNPGFTVQALVPAGLKLSKHKASETKRQALLHEQVKSFASAPLLSLWPGAAHVLGTVPSPSGNPGS